jgi:hypothetical protein
VDDLWRAYRELPSSFLTRYRGVAGRKALAACRLIEHLLLGAESTTSCKRLAPLLGHVAHHFQREEQ